MAATTKLFAVSFLLCVLSSYCLHVPIEVEQKAKIPPGWNQIEEIQKSRTIELTFALKQRNLNILEDIFWSVSDPKSSSYGEYLSFDQVTKLVAPTSQDIQTVISWLVENGVRKDNIQLTKSKDFLKAKLDLSLAEQLLATEFQEFQHSKSGKRIIKAVGSYSAPEHIADKIDFISGFRFPSTQFTRHHVKEPVESLATQTASNGATVVYINPLDQVASVTFLPLCSNGQVTTVSNTAQLCSDQTPSQLISSFIIQASQARYNPVNFTFNIGSNLLTCKQCDMSSGHMNTACTQQNQVLNLPNNTVYCEATFNNLRNYAQTVFSVVTQYSDKSTSVMGAPSFATHLSKFVTPQELWSRYNVPQNIRVTNPNNNQSVAEFLDQYYSPDDLHTFFNLMGLYDNTDDVIVIGPNNITEPGGEASLDIQYIMGVAQDALTVFWSLGGLHDGQEPFLEWITDVLNDPSAPLVHSISYGDDEDSLSLDYMDRINSEFQKAGVRGLSLFFSSGDNGVFGGASFDCPKFTPSFPASSPYVTTVGATLFSTLTTPICQQNYYGLPFPCETVGETTSSTAIGSRITSGGGFSNLFSTPSYQKQAVNQYLPSISNIPTTYYSPSGRAYPDVSAIGHNFLVILGGSISPIDGTSASAPTFAGIVTLLNDIRLNNHLPPVGFINPLLYTAAVQNSTAFFDIVTGDNSCSELSWVCCDYGYPAVVGFDAVTGLGSPNFETLSKLMLQNDW